MTPSLLLILGCLLTGRVLSPQGEPVPEAALLIPETGRTLGATDAEGRFSVEVPDTTTTNLVVEVWREGSYAATAVLDCGRPRDVFLPLAQYRLAPIPVIASPLSLPFETAAVRVESLPPAFLERAAAASPSVAQALQQLPGVGAVGRDGYTSAPTIRGLGRDRSLVFVEGMRLSSDRGVGPTASFLDPFLVDEVRVVRGTAGSVYGSGAMGGALLLGLGAAGDSVHAAARVGTVSGFAGRFAAARAGSPLGGRWRGTAGGFYRTQDDYPFPRDAEQASGDAINSGFTNAGGALILEREARGGSLRLALFGASADEVGRPTTQPLRLDTIEREDHLLGSVQYRKETERRRREWSLGFHRPRTVNRTERFRDDRSRSRTGVTENRSVDAAAKARVEEPWREGAWLAGFDLFTRRNVDAVENNTLYEGTDAPTSTRVELVTDADRLDMGAYAGFRHPLRLEGEVVLAARLDWARRRARAQPAASWVSPSFDLRASLPLNGRWALTAAVGRAFRAPRIQELYFEGDRPGGSRRANPDLDPESAWAAEAGVSWGAGPWTSRAALWGLLADRLIVQLPVDAGSDTLRHENVTRGRLVGVEAELAWAPLGGRARAAIAYAFVHGRDRNGAPLPDIPPGELRLSGEMRVAGRNRGPAAVLWGAGRVGAAKTPPADGADERWWSAPLGATAIGGDELGHPGFARWDLGTRVQAGRNLRVDLAITNLFDARYRDRPEDAAYPQPGRSLTVEITVTR